ncbi:MAG: 50S ribosomal protein L10 [Candidatus Aenigmarchaeota archaeon]|nr:50S ribosomal protein L10 [Candidatus Aenigmarchaeota archaeon]
MTKPKSHVSERKLKIITQLEKLTQQYPVVGVVNMEGMPTPQLQRMRAQLRDKLELFMTRKSLLLRAIENAKKKNPKFTDLAATLKGIPALLFTKENPFSIYKILNKSKSPAPAKPGQIAPKDLIIPAGPTPFSPGPVISEFAQLGIKTGVEGGKVAVKEPKVVVKEGEIINANVAGMLARLGIEPMEIGIDVIAILEKDTVYKKDVLAIDETQFLAQLQTAAAEAHNLAIEASYPTTDTIQQLVQTAFMNAKTLALESNIMADAVVEELLAKAERQAQSLQKTTETN